MVTDFIVCKETAEGSFMSRELEKKVSRRTASLDCKAVTSLMLMESRPFSFLRIWLMEEEEAMNCSCVVVYRLFQKNPSCAFRMFVTS